MERDQDLLHLRKLLEEFESLDGILMENFIKSRDLKLP